jgi:hypothetical protein
VVVRGSLEEGRVLAFYLRGDRLVGALVSGVEKETQESLTELLREQPRVGDRSLLVADDTPPQGAFQA